ncbi:uncharacterized protein LOC127800107 isoform X2 [Diospyros lotus]|uniref:uncharacterized protein LOC127800107 isoform X2 n=1 Tax=Diospyros lotus TaxID=55363 RepID=UPI0022591455|nr:uncharacterized protein LOC127800107 isoform X2 [Diospyros lotus]
MSWLWNSMVPEINDTIMFFTTTKDIWEVINLTYSKVKDAAQIYEIRARVAATKQGSKTITEYANMLQTLWQELDHYQCLKMKCSEDAALHKRFVEKERIYDFLAGLNIEFDTVRVQILGKEDLPSLNEVISLIRAEEGRRGIMLEAISGESSALVSLKTYNQNKGPRDEKKPVDRDSLWCTFCKKPRHTIEKCWKLHGKPSRGGPARSQVHIAAANSQQLEPRGLEHGGQSLELNKAEIERLKNFLGSLDKKAEKGTGQEEDDWAC